MEMLVNCCACREKKQCFNIMMLDVKGPSPGKGWGCFQCRLSMDGASAVLCDDCLESNAEILDVCAGEYITGEERELVSIYTKPHLHDLRCHPEMMFFPLQVHWFADSRACGPDCLCSFCAQAILNSPIRCWNTETGKEARFHVECWNQINTAYNAQRAAGQTTSRTIL